MAAKKSEQTSTSFFPVLSKYDMKEVKIEDQGLARYINLDTENLYHGGINANKIFAKSFFGYIEE